MNGLKIESLGLMKKDGVLPGFIHHRISNGTSDFCCYFKNLVEKLDDYYWIIEENSTYISGEFSEEDKNDFDANQFKDFYEGASEEYFSYRMYDNLIFKKYIDFIIDDWNTIICIKKEKIKLKEFVDNLASKSGKEKEKFLKDNTEFIFLNIDGLFWIVFTHNESNLNVIRLDLKKMESKVKVINCKLFDYLNMIEYPC